MIHIQNINITPKNQLGNKTLSRGKMGINGEKKDINGQQIKLVLIYIVRVRKCKLRQDDTITHP